METRFTKGAWKQRRLFSAPIFVKDENTGNEWYHNEISIVDNTGRVICDVSYKTISPNEGWGNNETIEKWEANANLIAAAPEMFYRIVILAHYHGSIDCFDIIRKVTGKVYRYDSRKFNSLVQEASDYFKNQNK